MGDKQNNLNRWPIVRQFQPLLGDDTAARMKVDLNDLVEAGEWLSQELIKSRSESMTTDELENFLIDLDINFIQHVGFHLKSLQADVSAALNNMSEDI